MALPTHKAFLAEPAVADPPRRVWRDWVLVAAGSLGLLAEVVVADVRWPWLTVPLALLLLGSSLWRRTRPLQVALLVFGALGLIDILASVFIGEPTVVYSYAWVLVIPYSLFRWASGRHAVIAISVMLTSYLIQEIIQFSGLTDFALGIVILLAAVEMGVVMRYRAAAREQRIVQIKDRERRLLARDLHDTVAHHVSAIAIQAQAAQVVMDADPTAAAQILATIEGEASRTLREMRQIVGALRDEEEDPQRAPQQGLALLPSLARPLGARPPVVVAVTGAVSAVSPPASAAVFRLAQESVTNATRHARNATKIDVDVTVASDLISLRVHDDGAPRSDAQSQPGFGIIGMRERASLLGGRLEAGPDPAGGWTVSASLPLGEMHA